MKRYLIVSTSDNSVETTDELDDEFMEEIDEIVTECEIIDLQEGKFYRQCGWLDIKEA